MQLRKSLGHIELSHVTFEVIFQSPSGRVCTYVGHWRQNGLVKITRWEEVEQATTVPALILEPGRVQNVPIPVAGAVPLCQEKPILAQVPLKLVQKRHAQVLAADLVVQLLTVVGTRFGCMGRNKGKS